MTTQPPATTQKFTVRGMTCEHCATSVREELSTIAGVTSVTVDVPSGVVEVASVSPVAADDVRHAIDEAGYALVA